MFVRDALQEPPCLRSFCEGKNRFAERARSEGVELDLRSAAGIVIERRTYWKMLEQLRTARHEDCGDRLGLRE